MESISQYPQNYAHCPADDEYQLIWNIVSKLFLSIYFLQLIRIKSAYSTLSQINLLIQICRSVIYIHIFHCNEQILIIFNLILYRYTLNPIICSVVNFLITMITIYHAFISFESSSNVVTITNALFLNYVMSSCITHKTIVYTKVY